MLCKKCGKEIDDKAKFCMHCGNSVDVKTKKKTDKNEKIDKIMDDLNNDVKKKFSKKKIIFASIIAVIVLIVVIIVVIVANSGTNLKGIYEKLSSKDVSYLQYMKIASDNSYIAIDTNPKDKDDFFSKVAYDLVQEMNKELGFPESLNNKMDNTRSIDGKQTEKLKDIEVTWTYHPDKGLEVQYTKNN